MTQSKAKCQTSVRPVACSERCAAFTNCATRIAREALNDLLLATYDAPLDQRLDHRVAAPHHAAIMVQ